MIRKAVIPAAGFGTRMFPVTLGIKKEFLPLVDKDKLPKPAIQIIIEDVIASGIEEICLIIQPEDEIIFKNYFNVVIHSNLEKKLRSNDIYEKEIDKIRNIGKRLHFVYQKEQLGFGHAVFQAIDFVKNDSFLLILGDQICVSHIPKTCSQQIIDVFENNCDAAAAIALTKIKECEVHHYGCAAINPDSESEKLFLIEGFIEKPDLNTAKKMLKNRFLEDGFYYCVLGQYIFRKEIFDYLKYEIDNDIKQKGEFQLTSTMDRFCRNSKLFYGFETKGEYLDIGRPDSYLKAISFLSK